MLIEWKDIFKTTMVAFIYPLLPFNTSFHFDAYTVLDISTPYAFNHKQHYTEAFLKIWCTITVVIIGILVAVAAITAVT